MEEDEAGHQDPYLTTTQDGSGDGFRFLDCGCDKALLVVEAGRRVHLYGDATVEAVAGRTDVCGYVLSPGHLAVRVSSYQGSAALYFASIPVEESPEISCLIQLGVPLMESTRVCRLVERGASAVLLTNLTRVSYNPHNSLSKFSLIFDTPRHQIASRLTIEKELSEVKVDGVTVVCGGQGSGKSSRLRYLCNRALNSTQCLLYIDLDVGQPEFTLQECVSAVLVDKPILGPPYTHFTRPAISFCVGNLDVSHCVDAYLKAVRALVERCKLVYSHLPWLVNTMGYSRGLGPFIIASCIAVLSPSLVIQLVMDGCHNFKNDLTFEHVNTLSQACVSPFSLLKVSRGRKRIKKDPYHLAPFSNKEMRWLCVEKYFSQGSYPLTMPLSTLRVFNLRNRQELDVSSLEHLVGRIVVLSNSENLEESPLALDHGVILATTPEHLIILTPLSPTEIKSVLVGSLQVPSRMVSPLPDPLTSGLLPYCQLHSSRTQPQLPALKAHRRSFRFLFSSQ